MLRNLTVLAVPIGSPFWLSGCVGQIVGATVDTAIEVAKVPFKVGGAVVDVVSGDDDEKKK